MSTILVTGAAGFIGSNFVRYWRRAPSRRPRRRARSADVRRRPRRIWPTWRTATASFVHADIGDAAAGRGVLDEHDVDVIVNFAAESHNSLAVLDPGPVLPHQRAGHPGPVRGRPPGRRQPLPPRVDVRGLRRPRPRRPRCLHRGLALPAAHAVQRVQGGRATTSCGPTTRRATCPSRSPTAPTTTGRTSSPRR